MKKTNLTEISVNRAIFKIAFPAIFSFFFVVFFELIDTFWLNKLNYEGVFASLGAASFITWSLYSLMRLINAGVNSMVSQFVGAKNREKYETASWEGLLLAFVFGLIITAIMHVLHPVIFEKIGLDGQIYSDACTYFRIMNLGFVVLFLFQCCGVIFKAHGDTKINMIIEIAMLVVNAVLDPVLILGYFGAPRLGIAGAAYATVISQIGGLIIAYTVLVRHHYIPALPHVSVRAFEHSVKILKIGAPVALTSWVFAMVYPALTRFITMLDNTAALGALNICHKIEGVAYFVAVGFSISSSTLSGQYFGAQNIQGAIKSVNRTVLFTSIMLGASSLAFIFIPDRIISLIVDGPDIIREGSNYLRIIGYFEIFLGWEIVFEGAFTGLGITFYPMAVSIPLTLARIPLGYLFAFKMNMGVTGLWWAISLSTFAKGTVIALLFWSGVWKRHVK